MHKTQLGRERVLTTPLCTLFGSFEESLTDRIETGIVAVFLFATTFVILVLFIMLVKAANSSASQIGRKNKLSNQGLCQYVVLACFVHIFCWIPSSIFFFLSVFKNNYPIAIHNFVHTVVLAINPMMNPVLFNFPEIKRTTTKGCSCLSRKAESPPQ